jgi:hypothetical protein
VPLIGHPEPSLFEGVRISSFKFFFINTLNDEILTSSGKNTGLLRMTKWMVEIATSHKTLLAMTDLDRYFHPHLVL